MAATCMAVCKGSRKKIRGIFISSCHLPAAVECDIVILSKPGPNPTGSSWAVLRTQLIPARGRKPLQIPVYALSHATQLIPARGRKPTKRWAATPLSRHNLSPRGDGNHRQDRLAQSWTGHNLSPRGDGNDRASCKWEYTSDTTYPREGTETAEHACLCSVHKGHNLSPRGDGNSSGIASLFRYSSTQLIPARGRKQVFHRGM